MIDAGLEAILIKVAGIGLVQQHLGKTLDEMQPTLVTLVSISDIRRPLDDRFCQQNDRYGSHICGEGGEYETLTLDCSLFKRRINM